MDIEHWNIHYEGSGIEFEEALNNRSLQFTYLGAFGLKDPLRENIKSIVTAIRQKDKVNVRMISGDHIETAKRVAYQAGIIDDGDFELNPDGHMVLKPNIVMEAEEFRNMVGEITQKHVEGQADGLLALEHEENFTEIAQNCKVLANANSHDKFKMVIGLKNTDVYDTQRVIAVTGDKINDIEALSVAHIGLAMGSGCSAAKQVASLILTGDDFEAVIRAIMWGRNIYHNVGRFLQF